MGQREGQACWRGRKVSPEALFKAIRETLKELAPPTETEVKSAVVVYVTEGGGVGTFAVGEDLGRTGTVVALELGRLKLLERNREIN